MSRLEDHKKGMMLLTKKEVSFFYNRWEMKRLLEDAYTNND
jgi:hypothetical protein